MLFGIFGSDAIGQIISVVAFFALFFFYPRLMVTQIMLKLERSQALLESYSKKGTKIVKKKMKNSKDKDVDQKIDDFLDFFVSTPVNLDPYGIVKKYEHIIDLEKERFEYFVDQEIPEESDEYKANVVMGLSGAMTLNQLYKVVRHYVETIKKTKAYNLAMIIQMQMPMIEKMAKGYLKGTEALANGWPVGDTIGPFIAAQLIDDSKTSVVKDRTIVCKKKLENKDVILMKARGPGGRLGDIGRILNEIGSKEKISKIITVDAAAKLEGEKTGTVNEGVGVAMGGIGVERTYIEDYAVKKKIPLDAVIVKMSQEEAIMPMREEVLDAHEKAIGFVKESIHRTNKPGKIIIVGVGNTSGVGNNKKEADSTIPLIRKLAKKIKEREELEKKKRNKFNFFRKKSE